MRESSGTTNTSAHLEVKGTPKHWLKETKKESNSDEECHLSQLEGCY
jgi:hypothetical protein